MQAVEGTFSPLCCLDAQTLNPNPCYLDAQTLNSTPVTGHNRSGSPNQKVSRFSFRCSNQKVTGQGAQTPNPNRITGHGADGQRQFRRCSHPFGTRPRDVRTTATLHCAPPGLIHRSLAPRLNTSLTQDWQVLHKSCFLEGTSSYLLANITLQRAACNVMFARRYVAWPHGRFRRFHSPSILGRVVTNF